MCGVQLPDFIKNNLNEDFTTTMIETCLEVGRWKDELNLDQIVSLEKKRLVHMSVLLIHPTSNLWNNMNTITIKRFDTGIRL